MLVIVAAQLPDPASADPLERLRATMALDLVVAGVDVMVFATEFCPGAAQRLGSGGVRVETSADPGAWARRHVSLARAVVAVSLAPGVQAAITTFSESPTVMPILALISELGSASHRATLERPGNAYATGTTAVTDLLAAREAATLSRCDVIACTDPWVLAAVQALDGAEERPDATLVQLAPPPVDPTAARGADRRHSQRQGVLIAARLFTELGLPDDEGVRALLTDLSDTPTELAAHVHVLGLDGPARLAPPLAAHAHTVEPNDHLRALRRARAVLLPRRFGAPQGLLAETSALAGVPVIGTDVALAHSALGPGLSHHDPASLLDDAARLVTDAEHWDKVRQLQAAAVHDAHRGRPSAATWVLSVLDGLRLAPVGTPAAPLHRRAAHRAPGTGWDGSAAAVRPGQERFERRLRTGWSITRKAGLHLQFIVGERWPYQIWQGVHEESADDLAVMAAEALTWVNPPRISVLMPTWNSPPALLEAAVDSVLAQVWPHWQLCIADDASTDPETLALIASLPERDERITVARLEVGQGIAGATNAALATADGEFVALLDHDDVLHPAALWWVARLLADDPALDVVYTDEDKLDDDGTRVEPLFKPDWNPDLLLGCNYLNHLTVLRRSLVADLGGWRPAFDGSQDHDLLLRITERTDRVGHVARPLYHWRQVAGSEAAEVGAKPATADAGRRAVSDALERRGERGSVEPGVIPTWHRVRWQHGDDPLVSVIIPTRNRHELLRRCLSSLRTTVSHPRVEIVIVDNESDDPATLHYLAGIDATVVAYPHPFNYARQMNLGAAAACGSVLLLLNNDTAATEPGWFEALLEQALRPEVGAVGLRLMRLGRSGAEVDPDEDPDDAPTRHQTSESEAATAEADDEIEVKVQHEGIVLGVGGQALNLTCGPQGVYGANVRDCAAVTAAALMCRTSAFWSVGGFDEQIPVAFNDVDFCLRLGAGGRRVVYTPWGELHHAESASRGALHPEADEAYYTQRWGEVATKRDAFYNAHLDLLDPFVLRL